MILSCLFVVLHLLRPDLFHYFVDLLHLLGSWLGQFHRLLWLIGFLVEFKRL
jgi:hypothetical protein